MSPELLAYSRPVAAARALGADAVDQNRFLDKRVRLTGDPAVLGTDNGRVMLLTALRLLPRLTPHVVVDLPRAPMRLIAEIRREAERIAFGAAVHVEDGVAGLTAAQNDVYDAVLSIGRDPDATRHAFSPEIVTEIVSNGWCVWVADRKSVV